jgi:hypothetical protein
MAIYPVYTPEDVAAATGGDSSEYTDFMPEAILQAILLFKRGTCLVAWPDDPDEASIARYGVLYMAEAIEAAQPWQKILRTPFSSETIGSYSYSKVQKAVANGLPTGVDWFDIAINDLSVCDQNSGIPVSGGYNVFEENKVPHGGYGVYLGPGDQFPDNWGPDTIDPEGL